MANVFIEVYKEMSQAKKVIRAKFRGAVFARDSYRCRVCGCKDFSFDLFDAHHITSRDEMPNGGYVAENGITLCENCHVMAEMELHGGTHHSGYSPEELYRLIGSSKYEAIKASKKLSE
jgi:predicted restriction endonuclease